MIPKSQINNKLSLPSKNLWKLTQNDTVSIEGFKCSIQHVKLFKLMYSRYRPIADAVLQAEVPGHVDNLRVEGGGDEEPRHQDVSVTLEAF